MRNKHLVLILVVVVAAWLYLHHNKGPLPWNVGQAGSIFDGRRAGGGQ